MKFTNMTDEQKNNSQESSQGGSSTDDLIKSGPSQGGSGEGEPGSQKEPVRTTPVPDNVKEQYEDQKRKSSSEDAGKAEDAVSKKEYEGLKTQHTELEQKLGLQGQELGKYREFYEDIKPLLTQLNTNPELVDLIKGVATGNISSDLVKGVIEGKVSVAEAETVTKAHDEVKKDLGKKEYDKASPDDIDKLVESKLEKFKKEISEDTEIKEYEKDVTSFLTSVPDYAEIAPRIEKYIDEHRDVTDIRVIYAAVKGEMSMESDKKSKEKEAGEAAKNVASSTAGGPSEGSSMVQRRNAADELIAGRTNPNLFG